MNSLSSPPRAGEAVDLLVAGAGIFGLWTAKRAVEAGLKVAIAEPRRPGAGASGGLLGALTAHSPDRWNPKKQFQFDALTELPGLIAALEAETGLSAGYRRCGRLMPIAKPGFLSQVKERVIGAEEYWRVGADQFVYEARSLGEAAPLGWISPEAAPLGAAWDSLAARVSPRAYVGALWAWLRPRVTLYEQAYTGWDGAVVLSDGGRVATGAAALAAGYEAFPLIASALDLEGPVGGGVKGQSLSARLAPGAAAGLGDVAALPLIYEDGVYVAVHEDGTVAVSGTSERDWEHPGAVDPANDGFWRRAQALCPALEGAAVLEWWAGVRPRAAGRDPMIGRLPGKAPIYAVAGGYKISFGIAHRVAQAVVDEIMGASMSAPLPPSFTIERHFG
ncbi:MAG: FAD-binding oxidoreductase [Rhodobacteraceae bacterium]|nr:FAD-binding oxidoreductase [Paracoccaceae bacterium]